MTLNRLLRGGNWNNNSNNCRASKRNNNTPDNINNNNGFRVASTPRLELLQEIAAGKAKSPGTEPGLPKSSRAKRAGESRRSESSSHHRDLGIQPAVVPRRAQLFAHSSSCNALHKRQSCAPCKCLRLCRSRGVLPVCERERDRSLHWNRCPSPLESADQARSLDYANRRLQSPTPSSAASGAVGKRNGIV